MVSVHQCYLLSKLWLSILSSIILESLRVLCHLHTLQVYFKHLLNHWYVEKDRSKKKCLGSTTRNLLWGWYPFNKLTDFEFNFSTKLISTELYCNPAHTPFSWSQWYGKNLHKAIMMKQKYSTYLPFSWFSLSEKDLPVIWHQLFYIIHATFWFLAWCFISSWKPFVWDKIQVWGMVGDASFSLTQLRNIDTYFVKGEIGKV